MRHRSMAQFASVAKRDLFRSCARNGEANRIPIAPPRKMRTRAGIAEIAEVEDVGVCGRYFLSGGAARTTPSRAQWQT